MNKPETKEGARLVSCTSRVVSGYAAGNKLSPDDLVAMVMQVAEALASARCAKTVTLVPPPLTPEGLVDLIRLGRIDACNPRRLTPAEIAASVQDRYLVSFENGRHYFMLRRHLTTIGMTPDEYRAKWGLPDDYSMVAPYYARRRQHLAKRMRLGNHERPPLDPSKDKRKFRLVGTTCIVNVPGEAPLRVRGKKKPERQNPVRRGTGMMVTPEVPTPAMGPQQTTPAPLDAGVMATPDVVIAAANPV